MKTTLFYEHVTVLDYAYLDPHLGVIGDSLIVDVEFFGGIDHEGVVYDFSYAKKRVKEIIDLECDHRLLVPHSILDINENVATLSYTFAQSEVPLFYRAPREAFCVIPSKVVTRESIAVFLQDRILPGMPQNIEAVKIKLREEGLPPDASVFHYTHGLKEHYGNCQRLFHGHRNTVEVMVNGQRRGDLEKWLAYDQFNGNIHFCFEENIVNKEEVFEEKTHLKILGEFKGPKIVQVKYLSSQGEFYAEIPGHMVYMIPKETTVENLSLYFAKMVKEKVGVDSFVTVRAFEGIGKGSLSTL